MVRDRNWKYIWNATDIDELYNMQSDPGELRNRIDDPMCSNELARLRKRLWEWMRQTHDVLANQFVEKQFMAICSTRRRS